MMSDLYAMGVVDCDNLLLLLGIPTEMDTNERTTVTSLMMQGFQVSWLVYHTRMLGFLLHTVGPGASSLLTTQATSLAGRSKSGPNPPPGDRWTTCDCGFRSSVFGGAESNEI